MKLLQNAFSLTFALPQVFCEYVQVNVCLCVLNKEARLGLLPVLQSADGPLVTPREAGAIFSDEVILN